MTEAIVFYEDMQAAETDGKLSPPSLVSMIWLQRWEVILSHDG